MTKTLKCLCLLLLSISSIPSIGFGLTEIYLVDVQRALNDSVEGKAARNNVEVEVKKAEAALAKQKAEIDRMKSDLSKQSSLLSPEAVEDKKKAISRSERNLGDSVREQQEELKQRSNKEIAGVITKIDAAIKELAANGKYPVILEKDGRWVLYSNPRLDVTDEVIKILDSRKTGL